MNILVIQIAKPFFFQTDKGKGHNFKYQIFVCEGIEIGRSVFPPAGKTPAKVASVGWPKCINTRPPRKLLGIRVRLLGFSRRGRTPPKLASVGWVGCIKSEPFSYGTVTAVPSVGRMPHSLHVKDYFTIGK